MSSWDNIKDTAWTLIGFAVAVGVIVLGGKTLYELDRDLDSLAERAAVAGDAGDMRSYLEQLAANMRKYDAASGHAAYIFKNPRNDLGAQYRCVQRVIERLQALERLRRDDPGCQQGLDDLRGVVRDLPRISFGVFLVRGPSLMCRELGACDSPVAAATRTTEPSKDPRATPRATKPIVADPSFVQFGPVTVSLGMPLVEVEAAFDDADDYRLTDSGSGSLDVERRGESNQWVPVGFILVRDGVTTKISSTLAAETSASADKMALGVYAAAAMMLRSGAGEN
jgi:hypothetical protein